MTLQRDLSGQDLSDENLDSNTLLMKKALSIPSKSKLMGGSVMGAVRAAFILSDNGNLERIIRKRKRKNTDQLKTLMREFERLKDFERKYNGGHEELIFENARLHGEVILFCSNHCVHV